MAFPDHAGERGARRRARASLVAAAVVHAGSRSAWARRCAPRRWCVGLVLPLVRTRPRRGAVQRLGLLAARRALRRLPHAALRRCCASGADGWRWVLVHGLHRPWARTTGGYFAGRAFGRHKLLPAVSPSKTVEGAHRRPSPARSLIALLCRAASSSRSSAAGEAIGARRSSSSVLAQLGDLCESALKRAFGAKDSGWIIPGHGGILDRLDSLLFPFVFVYYYCGRCRGRLRVLDGHSRRRHAASPFIVVLGVLVFVHELGHFLVAKRLGVQVLRFSIGFGPVLFARRRGETEYALSAIPLGGYVKMLGEDDDDEPRRRAEPERAFSTSRCWKRARDRRSPGRR